MTSLSEAAQYAIAQARERLAELRLEHCRCGVPRDECGDHKQAQARADTEETR